MPASLPHSDQLQRRVHSSAWCSQQSYGAAYGHTRARFRAYYYPRGPKIHQNGSKRHSDGVRASRGTGDASPCCQFGQAQDVGHRSAPRGQGPTHRSKSQFRRKVPNLQL